ncbi:MAG: hydrogenase maturation protein HypF [Bdellovibrionales bacterium]
MTSFETLVATRIKLPRPLPAVLGVGAFLKNELCLIQGDEALMSTEVGSLETPEAVRMFRQAAQTFLEAAPIAPVAIAHDLHPDFYCTRWAQEQSLPTYPVQHHHAHAAAVMAEYGIEKPVLALTLDGFGMGPDQGSWGGELLRVDSSGYSRLGHLYPFAQPGGDVAARQPWRMGAAALYAMGRKEEIAERYADYPAATHLQEMIDRGINAPLTSSAGRLFDAACGLLNVVPVAQFEGEAPIALEKMATAPQADPNGWMIGENLILDLRPLLSALTRQTPEQGANLFHGTLAAALLDWTHQAAAQTGIKDIVLCGGCFFNKVLTRLLTQGLCETGLSPLAPKALSPGDNALALGQAYATALLCQNSGGI